MTTWFSHDWLTSLFTLNTFSSFSSSSSALLQEEDEWIDSVNQSAKESLSRSYVDAEDISEDLDVSVGLCFRVIRLKLDSSFLNRRSEMEELNKSFSFFSFSVFREVILQSFRRELSAVARLEELAERGQHLNLNRALHVQQLQREVRQREIFGELERERELASYAEVQVSRPCRLHRWRAHLRYMSVCRGLWFVCDVCSIKVFAGIMRIGESVLRVC